LGRKIVSWLFITFIFTSLTFFIVSSVNASLCSGNYVCEFQLNGRKIEVTNMTDAYCLPEIPINYTGNSCDSCIFNSSIDNIYNLSRCLPYVSDTPNYYTTDFDKCQFKVYSRYINIFQFFLLKLSSS
jgi:hypothetical protein